MLRAAANPLAARDGWICFSPKKTGKTMLIKKDNRVPARCMEVFISSFAFLPDFFRFEGSVVRMLLPWQGSVAGMGLPGAAAWLDHGLVPPCSSEPGRGFVSWLASRSALGSTMSSAQGQSLAGSAQRQAELSSPWLSAWGGYSLPNVPHCFGASPRWLHAMSAHPPAQGQGSPSLIAPDFVDLGPPLPFPVPGRRTQQSPQH